MQKREKRIEDKNIEREQRVSRAYSGSTETGEGVEEEEREEEEDGEEEGAAANAA